MLIENINFFVFNSLDKIKKFFYLRIETFAVVDVTKKETSSKTEGCVVDSSSQIWVISTSEVQVDFQNNDAIRELDQIV